MLGDPLSSLETTAHVIQLALTPVFLLSGIASLLGAFSTRLARVADQVDRVADLMEGAERAERARLKAKLDYLRRRSHALDAAVVLGALGGAMTCAAVLTLFVGALRDARVATLLFGFFGGATLCTILALAAFGFEMLLAGRGLRVEVEHQETAAAGGRAPEG
jgi:hypothetical protein